MVKASISSYRILVHLSNRCAKERIAMGKQLFRRYGIFVAIGILAAVIVIIFISNNTNSNIHSDGAEAQPTAVSVASKTTEKREMRAVWVPYFSLNMAGEQDQSELAFQQKFNRILREAKSHKMNTLIVQVRPFADAFYPSVRFPWSSYLTGTQGMDPGYDPLAYMVQSTHNAGMEFHAWINPLRIQVDGVPEQKAESNLYNLWKDDPEKEDWCLSWEENDGIYLNPGIPEVRQYIADGVREIVEQYDVDGIQFDDYFYPAEEGAFDQETYQNYCDAMEEGKIPLSQKEWRKANISSLIALVYTTVHETDSSVVFGVSPQGNVENNEKIGADVTAWCSTVGYVDYICPQLYYNFENPVLPFDKAAAQWKAMVTNREIKLYFGLALYKASSDVDEGTWRSSDDILAREVNIGRKVGCDGFMFYSYEQLNSEKARQEVENVMQMLE